jgi:circadian clock protein KaiC
VIADGSAVTVASGVLTGSSRITKEAKEKAEQVLRNQEIENKQLALDRKRKAINAQIDFLKAEFEAEEIEALKNIELNKLRENLLLQDRVDMAKNRKGDIVINTSKLNKPKGNDAKTK